jgi:hypothetical protein
LELAALGEAAPLPLEEREHAALGEAAPLPLGVGEPGMLGEAAPLLLGVDEPTALTRAPLGRDGDGAAAVAPPAALPTSRGAWRARGRGIT